MITKVIVNPGALELNWSESFEDSLIAYLKENPTDYVSLTVFWRDQCNVEFSTKLWGYLTKNDIKMGFTTQEDTDTETATSNEEDSASESIPQYFYHLLLMIDRMMEKERPDKARLVLSRRSIRPEYNYVQQAAELLIGDIAEEKASPKAQQILKAFRAKKEEQYGKPDAS